MLLVWYFVLLTETFVHVHGWGAIGHNIIARLAQTRLTGSSNAWIEKLVPWHWNGNLSAMASWADSIIHENSNPTGFSNWQWSRSLHFINVPDWNCSYQVHRDCIDDQCIDGAIRNYTKRLESDLDNIQYQEALYFLVHFIGDIHQPLHVSFQSDRGGNIITGRFMNLTSQTNLHSLWDSGVINYRIQKEFRSNSNEYYNYIYQLMMDQQIAENDNDIQQWIKESLLAVCQQVYFDDNNIKINSSVRFNLNENYYRRSYPIIDQRLAQAGRRLGVLLNRLGQNRPVTTTTTTTTTTTESATLHVNIYIFIAALAAVLVFAVIFVIVALICCRNKKP